jgi:hypothetical protein
LKVKRIRKPTYPLLFRLSGLLPENSFPLMRYTKDSILSPTNELLGSILIERSPK